MREALLYSNLKKGIRCDLCARRCVIKNGESGYCRVRVAKDDKLFSTVYGLIDGMAADPIEKKPLFHFAPGSSAFSISTSSCNFRCQFCLNYHSAHRETPVGQHMSPEDVISLAQKHSCDGITYTYTEPTVFFEFAYDTAKMAHEKGLFNTFVTNGYMTPEAVEYIAPYLDAASVNFKGSANKKFYSELMSVSKVEPIFTSMQVMKERNIFIEITNLIIPEVGDSLEDTRILSEWVVENLGENTPFHLTAFSPTYKLTHLPRTSAATLEKHIEVAKSAGLVFVYSGNVAGHDYENTYCPECGFKAVERYSVYLGSNNLDKDGNCPRCKTDLNMKGVQWMKQGKGQFKRF